MEMLTKAASTARWHYLEIETTTYLVKTALNKGLTLFTELSYMFD